MSDGEWKIEVKEVTENYPMDDADLDVLRTFRDREQSLGRWSQEVDEMLPGMKISPMLVVWQHEKPRVVTDHSASELNAEISIVRQLVFGNRASPRVWCIISGLLCWIAIRKFSILDLFVYMDDFFGWDYEDNMMFYHGQWRGQADRSNFFNFGNIFVAPLTTRSRSMGDSSKSSGSG